MITEASLVNISESITKILNALLGFQVAATMFKISLSIKENLGEITETTKIKLKNSFYIFAFIFSLLIIIEVFFVYTKLSFLHAVLLNAIIFSLLAVVDMVIMSFLLV